MRRTTICTVLAASTIAFFAGLAVSQQGQAPEDVAKKQLIDMMMNKGKPTEAHTRLEAFVGEADITSSMNLGPGMPALNATSVSTGKWVLGNRFVEVHSVPTPDSELPMESISYMGYDARTGRYFWWGIDSSDTYSVFAEGDYDAATNSLVLFGENLEPALGGMIPFRATFAFDGPDSHTVTISFQMPEAMRAQAPEGMLDADGFADVMEYTSTKRE